MAKALMTQEAFEKNIRPTSIKNYKTNTAMAALRKYEVILTYIYKDTDGKQFAKFSIDPKKHF